MNVQAEYVELQTGAVAPGGIQDDTGDDQFHAQLRRLSELSVLRAMIAVLGDWMVIAGSIWLACYWSNPILWIVAGLVIATRQHALLIIMHDASHHRFLPNRVWNDRLSNWFLAWPLLVSTEGYRENHLAHHLHLNTENDPDWIRKQGKLDWEFPKTNGQLARLLLRDFFGGGVVDQFKAIGDLSVRKLRSTKRRSSRFERIGYYCFLATAITCLGLWIPVLSLWFLPAFTALPVILRIRSIAEHFGVEGENELNSSRNMHPALWESLTVAPHNVGFHLDHHLYPAVPFYRLPRLHRLLCKRPDYLCGAHQSRSLFGGAPSSVRSEVSAFG